MIGVIPSNNKTYEVEGYFDSTNLIEGMLYVDKKDDRLYYYSQIEKRSNPLTGFFPVWDGNNKYTSNYSNKKYINDIISFDINKMSSNINNNIAKDILYRQRLIKNDEILHLDINNDDNMFTQCIKSIINAKKITLYDLIDSSRGYMDEKSIQSYYSSLSKISFMRYNKWCIWIDIILHLNYILKIFKNDKLLIEYKYPDDKFKIDVKYDSIVRSKDDPFKNCIKILMSIENLNKNELRTREIDDYTINNLFTTINSDKPISSHLFDRFIRMSNLSYTIILYEGSSEVFQYISD